MRTSPYPGKQERDYTHQGSTSRSSPTTFTRHVHRSLLPPADHSSSKNDAAWRPFDDLAKAHKLSADQRLAFHQENSAPLMRNLHEWLVNQLAQKSVEPNSSMGKAIQYMINHLPPLTLFLRVPDAPLDNNICERLLKQCILHRKNSLFLKSLRGAWVGDLFMSLIATCRLRGTNPFAYLTALLPYTRKMLEYPDEWMPWNYQHTLAGLPP